MSTYHAKANVSVHKMYPVNNTFIKYTIISLFSRKHTVFVLSVSLIACKRKFYMLITSYEVSYIINGTLIIPFLKEL